MKNLIEKEPIMTPSSSSNSESESDELSQLSLVPYFNNRKRLSKQMSLRDTCREAAWEKRREDITRKQRAGSEPEGRSRLGKNLTDQDLDELKGSIELGFGFKEEDGQGLCDTLPALDFYFAVNRQLSDRKLRVSSPSPGSTPRESSSSVGEASSSGSPMSPRQNDSWKICCPGDNPQHVKTRLRHWAQAVACSVRQCS